MGTWNLIIMAMLCLSWNLRFEVQSWGSLNASLYLSIVLRSR